MDQALHSMETGLVPISRNAVYSLLAACQDRNRVSLLPTIRRIRSLMYQAQLQSVSSLSDHLIRLFASCGSLVEANDAFWEIKEPTRYSWSSIISSNAKLGDGRRAMSMYYHAVVVSNVEINRCMIICGLKACVASYSYVDGMLIHHQILENVMIESSLQESGMIRCKLGGSMNESSGDNDVVIGSALIDMYAKCGTMKEAQAVFNGLTNPNLVSWNTMIIGFASQESHSSLAEALQLMQRMLHEGIEPDKTTMSSIVKVCGRFQALCAGKLMHDHIIQKKLDSDCIVGCAIVDMYIKCDSLSDARRVFDDLPNQDMVKWRAMIAGYAFHGHSMTCLQLFEENHPNDTFSSILKACSNTGSLDQGRLIHDHILRSTINTDIDEIVGSALVNMYSKCGSLEEARKVLYDLPRRNVVCWGALISGYARCGYFDHSQQCLDKMQQEGCKPNDLVLSSVLTSYANAGLVDEGRSFFHTMKERYGILPRYEHYVCMVDLLGRAGHLMEAEDLLRKTKHTLDGWMSLLSSCKMHGKVDIARHSFEQIVHVDPHMTAAYELMSDIYEKACMWKEAEAIRAVRKHNNTWKKPGKAWIELNRKVYEFVVGDRGMLQDNQVVAKRKILRRKMDEEGYQPQVSWREIEKEISCSSPDLIKS